VARFQPFAAIRYADGTDLAAVTAPPYDVLSPADRAALAARHPDNVVHIDVPVESDGPDRYVAAGALMQRWRAEGVLVSDAAPAFYRYSMEFTDEAGERRDVVGVFGALEVCGGPGCAVLPHEETTPKARTDRLDLTRATRTNLSAVWGLSLTPGVGTTIRKAPAVEVGSFDDPAGVHHTVERIDDATAIAALIEQIGGASVLIADGHHRYEVARQYRAEVGPGPADATLAFVVELAADQLAVQAIHRLLTAADPGALLAAIDRHFERTPAGPVTAAILPRLVAEGALALVEPDGRGWFLRPRPSAFAGLRDLDSERLRSALADVEHDVTYQHGVDRVLAALGAGDAQYGVLLRPVPINEIERTANERALMPPKSTFFAPKPKTGLVFRSLA
jgi:uncharacterized protein (DUF1015 family)